MNAVQATSESAEGLGQAVFMGKEFSDGEVQPESKQ